MKNRWFFSVSLWLFLPTANCLLPTLHCTAQEKSEVLKYARAVVDTLASPSMHGRGYVNKGDSIAADYIKKEFEKIGVKPIGQEFYQRFSFPVNTFPGKMNLHISTDRESVQLAGKNFLITSNSPEKFQEDSYKVSICDKKMLLSRNKYKKYKRKKFKKYVIVIDECGIVDKKKIKGAESWIIANANTQIIVVLKNDKLTWEVSQSQNKNTVYECNCKDSSHIKSIGEVRFDVEAKLIPNYQSQNILGYIKGTQYPDSFIVFSAHYDHLGRMGKDVYFPGANDNASGCAMLLNLAKYYSQHPPKYSVAFMAFCAEEVGLLGSKYYVEHPLFPLSKIKFLINMDIMGTGDEGIKVVNATEHKKEFDELVKINSEKKFLPSVQPRGKTQNSDHYFFSEAGVKTFFIYTLGGIKAYHDIYDRAETLPLTKFEDVYNLLLHFTDYLQK